MQMCCLVPLLYFYISVFTVHHVHVNRSAGIALQELYYSPQVQRFLNGTTSKELFAHKAIYRPGMLRKVGIHSITYKNCVYIPVH